MKRPGVPPPQWAHAAAGGAIVVPSAGKAAAGYAPRERPPAGWWNYHLNLLGQWAGYLAGPSLTVWNSFALPEPDNAFGFPLSTAVDTVTADDTHMRFRYVIATHDDTGPCVLVSRRGQEWVLRRNLPSGATDPLGVAFAAGRWIAWTASAVYTSLRDDASYPASGPGASALRDAGINWATPTLPASPGTLRAVAARGASHAALLSTSTKILISTDSGGTWSDLGVTGRQSGRDVVLAENGVAIEVSSNAGDGYLVRSESALTMWAHVQTLTGVGADTTWRVVAGPIEDNVATFAAFKTDTANPRLHASTDDGLTWAPVDVGSAECTYLTSLVYRDGVWVATLLYAPWVITSSDLSHWIAAPIPVSENTAAGGQVCTAVFGNGSWLVTTTREVLQGAPAVDPGPEGYTPNTTASPLSDAGWLRGRRIHTTAPTNGQVYAWVSASSRWEATTLTAAPSGAAGGDLGGTYPNPTVTSGANHTHTASQVTSAPWSSVLAPTEVETSDATPTTLASIATASSRSYAVDMLVVASRSPTAVVAWKLLATVHSDGGGTLTLNDVLTHGPTDGGASGMSATVDVSGSSIRVRVTGLGGTSVLWSVTGTVLSLEN